MHHETNLSNLKTLFTMKNFLAIILTIIAINVNARHLIFEGLELGCDFKTLDDHANKMGWKWIYEGSIFGVIYIGCFLDEPVAFTFTVENDKVQDDVLVFTTNDYGKLYYSAIGYCQQNGTKDIDYHFKGQDCYVYKLNNGQTWRIECLKYDNGDNRTNIHIMP